MKLKGSQFRRTLIVGSLAIAALIPVGAAQGAGVPAGPQVASGSGALSDLSPATADPTDGASATVIAVAAKGKTKVWLIVQGLNPAAAGTTFGAHVHTGPCVAGNGAAAGPHYLTPGSSPSDHTEMWLDFKVKKSGLAKSSTVVPFVIPAGGARSVVIHKLPTDSAGVAGARMACLPVQF